MSCLRTCIWFCLRISCIFAMYLTCSGYLPANKSGVGEASQPQFVDRRPQHFNNTAAAVFEQQAPYLRAARQSTALAGR